MGNDLSAERSTEQLAADAREADQIYQDCNADLDRRKAVHKKRIAERKKASK